MAQGAASAMERLQGGYATVIAALEDAAANAGLGLHPESGAGGDVFFDGAAERTRHRRKAAADSPQRAGQGLAKTGSGRQAIDPAIGREGNGHALARLAGALPQPGGDAWIFREHGRPARPGGE